MTPPSHDKVAGTERGRWIGQSVKRREDGRLLSGAGSYVADIVLPGALHVAILRSPHAHARILSIDVGAAQNQAGVVAVWTGKDVADRVTPLAPTMWKTPPPGIVERSKPVLKHDQQPILAVDRVRYVGEPIALIIAESRYLAEDAIDYVNIEYEPLPVVGTVEQALQPDAPLLNEEWNDNTGVSFVVAKGDVDRAFQDAPITVKERLRSHRYTSVPMETRGVAATVDGASGRLTVWSSTQVPHNLRDVLAAQFSLTNDQLRVLAPDVGGGFGVKGLIYPEDILIPLLALDFNRPVHWTEDRREHFLASIHAREQVHEIEVAADQDGRILGLRDDIVVDNGAYNPLGLVGPYNTVAHLFGMYDIPASHVRGRAVATNKAPHAPYRGAGRAEAVYAMERMLERVAVAAGKDPAEVRLRNLVPGESMPFDTGLLYRDGQPLVYDSGDYPHMFRRALELLDYKRWRAEQAAGLPSGHYIGIGLATYIEGTAIGPFETASVTVDPAGRVRIATGSASQGQGHETTFAQIAAQVLDVPFELVDVTGGDTAAIEKGFGTVASRSIVTGGTAVANASGEVRAKALAAGAGLLEASLDDVELVNGEVRVKGSPQPSISLFEMARTVPDLRAEAEFSPPTVTYSGGVHAAVVEVETETGNVKVLDYVVVHDCGRVVNPMIVDGQIMGGVAQGIGGSLFEELLYDDSGQLLTTSFMDYLIPTAVEMPDVALDHQEYPTYRNPLGLKGLGEGGAIPVQGLLANAVEDALKPFGIVIRETPLTPQKLRDLLKDGPSSGAQETRR